MDSFTFCIFFFQPWTYAEQEGEEEWNVRANLCGTASSKCSRLYYSSSAARPLFFCERGEQM